MPQEPFKDLHAFIQAMIAGGMAEDETHARRIIAWVARTPLEDA